MDASDPVVRTGNGSVRGRLENGIAVFRGMPFAQPPVGELRFAAPQPATPWDGIRDAGAFGPPPPQSGAVPRTLPPAGPEFAPDDWLTINVWSPDLGAAGLPVMVWIYGGAYRSGSSSQASYDGTRLARQGVVMVSFNYRVGVEGFGQLPGAPANRGLLDDLAALRWVRENVAGFGGDPDNVTVFGESAGAGAVASMVVMPAAAGLFRRGIAQSPPGIFVTPELAASVTAAIAAEAGIGADAFAATDPEKLRDASDAVHPREHPEWGLLAYADIPFGPVVDGEVLPAAPWRAMSEGTGHKVDLIIGHNRDEYRLFTMFANLRGKVTAEMASDALDGLLHDGEKLYRRAYPQAGPEELYELVYSDWLFRMPALHLAQAHAAGGGKTFLYELTYGAGPLGACHAVDVGLVFGYYDELGVFLLGSPPPAAAVELGDVMRAEWAAFAVTGDPGWPEYSVGSRLTRVYDTPPSVAPYPEQASMHLWDQRRLGVLDLR
jgi:para-nitrobenzyl esterase